MNEALYQIFQKEKKVTDMQKSIGVHLCKTPPLLCAYISGKLGEIKTIWQILLSFDQEDSIPFVNLPKNCKSTISRLNFKFLNLQFCSRIYSLQIDRPPKSVQSN